MYGYRARIGLIVPSSNTTAEMEFHKMKPDGVSIHAARVFNPENVSSAEEKEAAILGMNEKIAEAGKRIASIEPDIVVYACTTGSFIRGHGYDQEIIKIIEGEIKTKAITATTALIKALQALKVSSIDLITPYLSAIALKEAEVFKTEGFSVINVRNFEELAGNLPKGKIFPDRVYREAKEAASDESEGLVLSCTNMRTIEIIECLERDLRKPVISSNQAAMWLLLKLIEIDTGCIEDCGLLFQRDIIR